MRYPEGIIGPDLTHSDIVAFEFDGAELTFFLPSDIDKWKKTNYVIETRNFRQSDADLEDAFSDGCIELITQKWMFEDRGSLDNIASCFVKINLARVEEDDRSGQSFLSNQVFSEWFHEAMELDYNEGIFDCPCSGEKPNPGNGYLIEAVEKPLVNWLTTKSCAIEGNLPSPEVTIPVGKEFILNVSFNMKSLHYPDRKNPYTEEQIKQMEFDLFDEFLNCISVKYSPEFIEEIERLNAEKSE